MKRAWLLDSTELFLATVDALSDAEYAGPSGLPGWSRAHVVAHAHFNALALQRLASWAATGVEHPMYPSAAARNAEIEQGSRLSPGELRQLVHGSAADLLRAYDELTPDALAATVRTAQGRPIPAEGIAWLRTREMGIHAVDLATTVTFADLPVDLLHAFAADALGSHEANLPALTAYLTGRSATAPTLSNWL
ncbi:maleylpyruvate isomerase [Kribbella amoyensis]|uniref:Maleylpyruvate isomerase n=1 Tax=Kribbella amoyensis TaxID=996641 RepID=A0A561BZB0_9ACTN|nr:maleylpyruvate isomerase N-terminal domain-containing protein [Kribbella amoyensis]TWD84213.1 maleylpyruvate isomerase [Kribbella amoyensis]